MVSYQSPSSSSGYSASLPPLGYFKNQALAERVRDTWSPFYFGGDVTSPLVRMLSNLAYSSGRKESQKSRGRILSTPGLTSPAKASLVGDLEKASIESAAGVPSSIYNEASKALLGLIGQTSVSRSRSSGGGGGGICVIMRTLFKGELPPNLQYLMDSLLTGDTAKGYLLMAEWLVPLIIRSPLVRWLGEKFLLTPFLRYSLNKNGMMDKLLIKFWVACWRKGGLKWQLAHSQSLQT